MSQHYSNPKRASDPYALPDVETFYVHDGPRRSYDRSYVMDHCERMADEGTHAPESCDDCPGSGWYWWACFPGCLPDSDPVGPFETEAEALADAQEGSEGDA